MRAVRATLVSVSRWNIFSVVKPTLHVCCGYLENWLMSREDISRVKDVREMTWWSVEAKLIRAWLEECHECRNSR